MVARKRSRRVAALAVLGALLLANLAVVPARALAFTYIVDTKGDGPDADVANPACATAEGSCSLRAAIMQANALDPEGGHHTIRINGTLFFMSTENTAGDEDQAEEGDYDIWQDVHIVGTGTSTTIYSAGNGLGDGRDRIFQVHGANTDVTISGITLRYGDSGSGMGGTISVLESSQTLSLENVIIEKSWASNSGVAIYSKGDVTIRDSIIRNSFGRNSTIEMDGGDLIVRRTTISGNQTQLNASAIRLRFEAVGTIERSTISNNTSGTGGPILVGTSGVDDSALTIRNSTIAGNTAPGAMIASFDEGVTTVVSSTIAGNTGYGVDLDGPSSFKNTIFAGNSLGNCNGHPTSSGYNLDTGTSCGLGGPGDENGKPKLQPLAGNGGPTPTRALGAGSDAIDAGSGCADRDQRNVVRKDGDGDGQIRCDIGAYEAATVVLPTPIPTLAPTAAPTAPPTEAPTVAPSEVPPATTAPSPEPGATAAATAEPPGPSAPAASGGGPTVAPGSTAAPEPASDLFGSGPLLWIVLAIVAIVVAFGLGFALRRGGRQSSS